MGGKLRTTILSLLIPVIIATASSVRLPVIPICSRTALYLLAQYKLAVGDSRAAIELLHRAAEAATPPTSRGPACPATPIRERT